MSKYKIKCKRCNVGLRFVAHRDRGYCHKCWYLKQFRPYEFDMATWERDIMDLAEVKR